MDRLTELGHQEGKKSDRKVVCSGRVRGPSEAMHTNA